MKVLVDTCIWSQTLRKKAPDLTLIETVKDLIRDGRIVIIGPIRQELLSGISHQLQFDLLQNKLSSFEDITLTTEHFVQAAEFSNRCRAKGIQGSSTDFLICSVACLQNLIIFTTDNNFKNYKKHLPIKLLPS